MKRIVLNMFLALMGVITLSCSEDLLDKEPSNQISDQLITQNATTIDVAINGTYRTFALWAYDGLYTHAIAEVRSGDAFIAQSNNYMWFVDPYKMNLTTTNIFSSRIWERAYRVIDNVNVILSNIDEAEGDQAVLDNLKGEALAMRAYAYMTLAHFYQEKAFSADPSAPCVLLITEPFDAAQDPGRERATNQQIYNQIETDLLASEQLISENNRTGRLSRRAVQGLLARHYLEIEEWSDAASWASAAHRDQPLNVADITEGFFDYNEETLWGYDYTETDNGGFASVPSFWYFWMPGGTDVLYGYSTIRYTPEFVNKFANDDARKMFVEDYTGFFGADGSFFTYKFRHRNNELSKARLIKMRVGEMYLIEAEAKANMGDDAGAQDALFVVQSRSIPSAVKSTNTGQDLLDEIYDERDRELYGEGFGVLDNIRLNITVDRSSSFHWGNAMTSIPGDDPLLMLPIPQDEIDANPKLTNDDQNSAYR
jgi:hypothetical protein